MVRWQQGADVSEEGPWSPVGCAHLFLLCLDGRGGVSRRKDVPCEARARQCRCGSTVGHAAAGTYSG